MSDPAMLADAAIFLGGMLAGRAWPARRRRQKAVKPVCGCKHAASYHDPQTKECHEQIFAYDNVYRCACRQYTGPEPLPTVYAQEITHG